ncbi:MAG: hypothetical protein IDH49_05640 [Gammaproteobacteria bacterium]|nr:hypothetical protein [Gammaproteobacteria bacterium]
MLLSLVAIAGLTVTQPADAGTQPKDPAKAQVQPIDRFSAKAGKLQVRTASNGLPGPNEPVDFDTGPFITQGLSPDGRVIKYYNFDVKSTMPAPIYVLFREGEDQPVKGQLDIVDVIPGDESYNDFWRVQKVRVPKNYMANSLTSLAEIRQAGYPIERTDTLTNYPLVPDKSVARLRGSGESSELHSAWYRGKLVKYFNFAEREISTGGGDAIPVAPIYVTFNINPDQPNGGPASGFKTEPGSKQAHNVAQVIPADAGYSPLWLVSVYDNKDWSMVKNLDTVLNTKILAAGVATVNCPIVYVDRMVRAGGI